MALHSELLKANRRLQEAAIGGPALRQGERGEAVRVLQTGFRCVGHRLPRSTLPNGSLDGIYGQETAGVVQRFERRHNLIVDAGVAGRQVLGRLDALLQDVERGAGEAARVLQQLDRPNPIIDTLRSRLQDPAVRQRLSQRQISELQRMMADAETLLRQAQRQVHELRRPQAPPQLIAEVLTLVGLGGLLTALAVLLAAMIAIVAILYYIEEIAPNLQAGSYAVWLSQAVRELVGLRNRVRDYDAAGGTPEDCKPKLERFLGTLNRLIVRFQSPAARARATSTFVNAIEQLAEELEANLKDLLECLDPEDTTGLARRLVGSSGVLRLALVNTREARRILVRALGFLPGG